MSSRRQLEANVAVFQQLRLSATQGLLFVSNSLNQQVDANH